MFSFLDELVYLGIFEEVTFQFLMVGHTGCWNYLSLTVTVLQKYPLVTYPNWVCLTDTLAEFATENAIGVETCYGL